MQPAHPDSLGALLKNVASSPFRSWGSSCIEHEVSMMKWTLGGAPSAMKKRSSPSRSRPRMASWANEVERLQHAALVELVPSWAEALSDDISNASIVNVENRPSRLMDDSLR